MSIHDSNIFNQFLSSLRLQRPEHLGDFEKIEIIPKRILSEPPQTSISNPIHLWYDKSCHLTPNGLLKKLKEELNNKGHDSTSEIAKIILAVLCLTSDSAETHVERLNFIIETITPADSSQFWISPYPSYPDSTPYKIGRFIIGKLREEKLREEKLIYRCRKVGCDYFDRYPKNFEDRFAIEGEPISVMTIDWSIIMRYFKISHSEILTLLVDYYFEVLTLNLQDRFRQEFRSAQDVLVVAGASYFDLDDFKIWNKVIFIAIYQKIGNDDSGYFCPFETGIAIIFPPAHQDVPAKSLELKEKYNFTGLDGCEIHQSIGTYCRFVAKAKTYENGNRIDEAFLHYVIALDLLFGEKDASIQNVSKRTALVVSRALGEDFETMVKRIKEIYGKRSKYVHSGNSVSDQDIEQIRPIIEKVFLCLLRLQSIKANRSKGFVESWLKNLDYLIAAKEAGRQIEDKEFILAGLVLSPEGDYFS
jgi:hypothetical protein